MTYRYVKMLLYKNDEVIKIISSSDNLVDFKTMDNNIYSVDLFGVSIYNIDGIREMVIDLNFELDENLKQFKKIQQTYDEYIDLYLKFKNKIRYEKLKRILED